jgi:hypothetical protein
MKREGVVTIIILGFLAILCMPIIASAATQHSNITWNGPGTCLTCHLSEATEVHGSVHYQWQGQAIYTVNGPAVQGKLNNALNSYCINILGNWGTCGNCHAGLGAKPEPTPSASQLQNIDCLICHQKEYKRKKVNGVFVPDTANMTITMDQAVQTVHKPVRSNCLQCHAKGGGGDNNKRGDMALAHANTNDRNFDVHMANTGANLVCQSCHTTEAHKIAGRGSDLRETDLDKKIGCVTSSCHPTKLSSTGHTTASVNRHVKKVACQTCHIKTYARDASDTASNESTEIYRDWTKPEWIATLNRWEPTITRGSNLKPVYRFWNSFSYNYNLDEITSIDPKTGAYPTSRPIGSINDAASKLYPFKYKKALQPIATGLGKLIALDTSIYFATGNLDSATKQGLANMGLPISTPYAMVETDTFQLITHEVMPKDKSLTCNECHTSSATQMNLKEMGYVLKGQASSVCSQCHSYKDPSKTSYTSLHQKHVTDKKYDCAWCHNFTRVTYNLNITKTGTGSGIVISNPVGINCGTDCSEEFNNGTNVTLTATADADSIFVGWSGDSDCSDGVVSMNANKTCTAVFNKKTTSSSDLIVSALSAPTATVPGAKITISDTVKNQGSGTAGSSTIKFYWSSNNSYDSGDIYLGSRSVPSLASGATNSGSTTVTIPSNLSIGTYYIISRADADSVVAETNETNNIRTKSIAIGPDLTISSITAPSSANRGSTISIGDQTKNIGSEIAGTSTTKFYLSTNKTYESGDIYLGSRSIPTLSAGATNSGSISVTIPAGIPTGNYFIIAIADANRVVVEASEVNNTKTTAITINP